MVRGKAPDFEPLRFYEWIGRQVREGLAVDAVLDDRQVEQPRVARGGRADLGLEAVGVGAGVLALDADGVGRAGLAAVVKGGVEAEDGRGRGSRLDGRGGSGSDRADVDCTADVGLDH